MSCIRNVAPGRNAPRRLAVGIQRREEQVQVHGPDQLADSGLGAVDNQSTLAGAQRVAQPDDDAQPDDVDEAQGREVQHDHAGQAVQQPEHRGLEGLARLDADRPRQLDDGQALHVCELDAKAVRVAAGVLWDLLVYHGGARVKCFWRLPDAGSPSVFRIKHTPASPPCVLT